MDLPPEELQFLTISSIFKESISIPKRSPKTFYQITLSLIFPLSFAILAHSLFTHPLLTQILNPSSSSSSSHSSVWTKLLTFQFCYLIFLFAFSLLSTAAVVFTVASLYTSKPVSFSSTISAVPTVFTSPEPFPFASPFPASTPKLGNSPYCRRRFPLLDPIVELSATIHC